MPIIHINYTCFIIRESDYDLAKRIQMYVSVLFINRNITLSNDSILLMAAWWNKTKF